MKKLTKFLIILSDYWYLFIVIGLMFGRFNFYGSKVTGFIIIFLGAFFLFTKMFFEYGSTFKLKHLEENKFYATIGGELIYIQNVVKENNKFIYAQGFFSKKDPVTEEYGLKQYYVFKDSSLLPEMNLGERGSHVKSLFRLKENIEESFLSLVTSKKILRESSSSEERKHLINYFIEE